MSIDIQIFLNRSNEVYGHGLLIIHPCACGSFAVTYRDPLCDRNEHFDIPNKSTLLRYLSLFFTACAADVDRISGYQTIQFSIPKFPDFILKNNLESSQHYKIVYDALEYVL